MGPRTGRQEDDDTEGFPMLVLSRKLNEKIVINGDIVVTVVKIDRNQIRIGIEAPGHVPVYREEILPMARDFAAVEDAMMVEA
jgi:carbon storage regulator